MSANRRLKSLSFANRLTRKVQRAMLYVMSFTLAVTFLAAFRAMKSETRGRYVGMMNLVSEKINSEIKWMEIGAKNVFDEIECHLDSPEDIIKALEEEIRLNDYVEGYFVAFEPYYFPQQGKWFEPYTHKVRKEERGKGKEEAHTYQTDQVASANHDYFKADWYQRAKKESKPFWSDPYTLDNEKHLPGLFCTYIIPIYDKQGRFIGVFGADLLLKNLIRDLKRIDVESRNEGMKNISKRYSNLDFYSFIINEKGTYIAHPEEERAMKQNIRSYVENGKLYGDCERVIRDMTQMKKGIGPMKVDGLWADVYYSPLQSTNWSMAIVVQKRVFLQPIFYLLLILLLATALGEILISIICRRNIRKETRPLVSLTQSANEVAKGNFKAPLPELEYKDEVSNLRDSFATMQSSLTKYIQDLEETTTKKAAMENELNVAKKIQMSMIPNKFPPFPKRNDIDLFGSLTPAKTVGGDLFDYFIHNDHLFFCIGDVSGKGVPSALMMTVIHYLFRSFSSQSDDPKQIVEAMNDCYAADNKSMMFCTFFLGVLDLKTGLLRYCNAGHEAPYMVTSEVERIKVDPNMALGVVEGMQFTAQEKLLPDGGLLFLYTDGLTEATDENEGLFGRERVEQSLQNALDEGLTDGAAYIHRMTDDVAAFVKNASQSDDLTMLALRLSLKH